jgi:hypothetical protein
MHACAANYFVVDRREQDAAAALAQASYSAFEGQMGRHESLPLALSIFVF